MGTFAVGERNKMLDAVAGRTNYTASAAFYVKLHIGDPGAAGTSNAAGHTTRVVVTFGSAAATGSIANTAAVLFSSLSTAETLTHVSFWDASTAGTFLGSDDITSATVAIGDSLNIAIGSLTLAIA